MFQKILNCYADMFKHYADFKSQTSAPECVWALVAHIVVGAVINVILSGLYWVYYLLTIIPTLAISLRTLKTCGKSWAWILLNLLPYGGVLFILFLVLTNKDEKFL